MYLLWNHYLFVWMWRQFLISYNPLPTELCAKLLLTIQDSAIFSRDLLTAPKCVGSTPHSNPITSLTFNSIISFFFSNYLYFSFYFYFNFRRKEYLKIQQIKILQQQLLYYCDLLVACNKNYNSLILNCLRAIFNKLFIEP